MIAAGILCLILGYVLVTLVEITVDILTTKPVTPCKQHKWERFYVGYKCSVCHHYPTTLTKEERNEEP